MMHRVKEPGARAPTDLREALTLARHPRPAIEAARRRNLDAE
jgi:hypothetical protein